VKVQFAKFYQSVNLPKGAKHSLNENECRSMRTTQDGLLITTLDGECYLVPWSNLPFVRLEDEKPREMPTSESARQAEEWHAQIRKNPKPTKAKGTK
jgi:hypothetical protein